MQNKSRLASITSKRQITIPKDFFDELNLRPGKIKCYVDNGKIILDPLKENNFWDFSSEILCDLIEKGYEDKKLLDKFNEEKKQVKKSISLMLEEAKEEIKKGNYRSLESIFKEILEEE